jgi:hypothetical protein
MRGCYRPRLAIAIVLQIFAPDLLYRKLSDRLISHFGDRVWSHADHTAPFDKLRMRKATAHPEPVEG